MVVALPQTSTLVAALSLLVAVEKRLRRPSAKRFIALARPALTSAGFPLNPMGEGNEKTGLPGAYRPVGVTCPLACEFHPSHYDKPSDSPCYALHGKVGLAQERASADAMTSAVTALVIMYARQLELTGNARQGARLQTSGDFCLEGVVDLEYIGLLCEAARLVRGRFEVKGCVAYTYTHIPRAEFELSRLMLKAAGIEVMYSEKAGAEPLAGGTAVVWRHSRLDELQAAPGVKAVACPAQTRKDWACNRCTLCSVGAERVVVAFDPHGAKKNKIK